MGILKIFKLKKALFKHVLPDDTQVFADSQSLRVTLSDNLINFYSKDSGFIFNCTYFEVELYEVGSVTPIKKPTLEELIVELIKFDYGLFRAIEQTSNNHISATITTGGVAQKIINANENRVGFEIQNTSNAKLTLGFGVAPTATTGFSLDVGSSYSTQPNLTTVGDIYLFGATTGQTFTYIEY